MIAIIAVIIIAILLIIITITIETIPRILVLHELPCLRQMIHFSSFRKIFLIFLITTHQLLCRGNIDYSPSATLKLYAHGLHLFWIFTKLLFYGRSMCGKAMFLSRLQVHSYQLFSAVICRHLRHFGKQHKFNQNSHMNHA